MYTSLRALTGRILSPTHTLIRVRCALGTRPRNIPSSVSLSEVRGDEGRHRYPSEERGSVFRPSNQKFSNTLVTTSNIDQTIKYHIEVTILSTYYYTMSLAIMQHNSPMTSFSGVSTLEAV